VGCAVGKISLEKATRAMLPFYAAMVAVLLLITFVPQVVLFIPELVMGP
jgi:TRAP-type C4-dicarboxylate transport system permease large subunit